MADRGAAGTPTSGFEVFGSQLTITGATAAQPAGANGDGVIQLDGGSTLSKQDATTSDLGVNVLIDSADIHVLAGKLTGNFQGAGQLSVASGATLGLGGSGLQVAPPAIAMTGGTLEVEPGADVTCCYRTRPRCTASRWVPAPRSISTSTTARAGRSASRPRSSSRWRRRSPIAADATLAIAGGNGTSHSATTPNWSGSGTLDGSLASNSGTVSPSGTCRIPATTPRARAATLAIDLRAAGNGDVAEGRRRGDVGGHARGATAYAPRTDGRTARPPHGREAPVPFATTLAPLPGGRAWDAAYSAAGVTLGLAGGGSAPAGADQALVCDLPFRSSAGPPAACPAGGEARIPDLPVAARRQADRERDVRALPRRPRRSRPPRWPAA